DLDDARGVHGRLGAAKQRLYARDQLARAEWLGDVIVGAHLQADDAVGFITARRKHENRQAIQRIIPPNLPANVQTGEFRQHEVEQQEIRWRFLEGIQTGAAIVGGADLKAFIRKVITNQFDN